MDELERARKRTAERNKVKTAQGTRQHPAAPPPDLLRIAVARVHEIAQFFQAEQLVAAVGERDNPFITEETKAELEALRLESDEEAAEDD